MKKYNTTVYICSECGEEFAKWSGFCTNCKSWNTLKEFKIEKFNSGSFGKKDGSVDIVNLSKVKNTNFSRLSSGISEFNQVLGGGIVPGSVILLGGDPGIGKSTLLAQVINNVNNSLYISGEESVEQIKLRIERLKLNLGNFNVVSETNINKVLNSIAKFRPKMAVIDSIQTMYSEEFPSTPGSLVQVRESALKLQNLAKKMHIPIILIGHVTKEGNIAGPKILEHLVDVVLYLEGERYHNNRILRVTKNRFGAIDEIGIFEMTEGGMTEVKNPSKLFLDEKINRISGSVVTSTLEGNRPLLVEIQALVNKSVFGYPKRTTSGFDFNRLDLLLAILSRRARIYLDKFDVYVNIVGGLKIKDPAVDLAIAIAIVSAYLNKKVDENYCFFGELGLSGEIRKVKLDDKRIETARKIGFNKFNNKRFISELISDLFKK